ncbi:uncharacterized protein LOC112621745 [Theropithecus gelada]|uniref:uncharacterized protein LOC112621745 n=1 Tax=Theropithecus gelada TaxID=9565 RepID=UPI000DC185C2|nr:uncharacterized protein LOC112621745 [Theropithecus gelada]
MIAAAREAPRQRPAPPTPRPRPRGARRPRSPRQRHCPRGPGRVLRIGQRPAPLPPPTAPGELGPTGPLWILRFHLRRSATRDPGGRGETRAPLGGAGVSRSREGGERAGPSRHHTRLLGGCACARRRGGASGPLVRAGAGLRPPRASWSRLFSVAAAGPGVVAEPLWPSKARVPGLQLAGPGSAVTEFPRPQRHARRALEAAAASPGVSARPRRLSWGRAGGTPGPAAARDPAVPAAPGLVPGVVSGPRWRRVPDGRARGAAPAPESPALNRLILHSGDSNAHAFIYSSPPFCQDSQNTAEWPRHHLPKTPARPEVGRRNKATMTNAAFHVYFQSHNKPETRNSWVIIGILLSPKTVEHWFLKESETGPQCLLHMP